MQKEGIVSPTTTRNLAGLHSCCLMLIFRFLIHLPKDHCFNEQGQGRKEKITYESEVVFNDLQFVSKRFAILIRDNFSPNSAAINFFIANQPEKSEPMKVLLEILKNVKLEMSSKRKRIDFEICCDTHEDYDIDFEEKKEPNEIFKFPSYIYDVSSTQKKQNVEREIREQRGREYVRQYVLQNRKNRFDDDCKLKKTFIPIWLQIKLKCLKIYLSEFRDVKSSLMIIDNDVTQLEIMLQEVFLNIKFTLTEIVIEGFLSSIVPMIFTSLPMLEKITLVTNGTFYYYCAFGNIHEKIPNLTDVTVKTSYENSFISCCDISEILKCNKLTSLNLNVNLEFKCGRNTCQDVYCMCQDICMVAQFSQRIENEKYQIGCAKTLKHLGLQNQQTQADLLFAFKNFEISSLHLFHLDLDALKIIPWYYETLEQISFENIIEKSEQFDWLETILKNCYKLKQLVFQDSELRSLVFDLRGMQVTLITICAKYNFIIDAKNSTSFFEKDETTGWCNAWSGNLTFTKVKNVFSIITPDF